MSRTFTVFVLRLLEVSGKRRVTTRHDDDFLPRGFWTINSTHNSLLISNETPGISFPLRDVGRSEFLHLNRLFDLLESSPKKGVSEVLPHVGPTVELKSSGLVSCASRVRVRRLDVLAFVRLPITKSDYLHTSNQYVVIFYLCY